MKTSYFIIATLCLVISHSAISNTNFAKIKLNHKPLFQNDSWSLEAVLSQETPNANEGTSVSISADGTTLAVGSPNSGAAKIGETQVYVQNNNNWTHQATLSQGFSRAGEGSSVSLSADCNTLAAGAPGYMNNSGAAIMYVRKGSNWIFQDLAPGSNDWLQGWSVSLSADGNTLAAGAPSSEGSGKANGIGRTAVYVRSGNTWTQQATVSQYQAHTGEGASVSLSADGNTLAVSAPTFKRLTGATYIYVRSGNNWSYQTTLSQGVLSAEGASVKLSADATLLAAGAPFLSGVTGAVQIYSQSNNTWSHEATLSQQLPDSYEGFAVSLSSNTLLASGAPYYGPGNSTGGVLIYSKGDNSTWTFQALLSYAYNLSYEGSSVSLSGDGMTLAVGVPGAWSNHTGEAYIYDNSGM